MPHHLRDLDIELLPLAHGLCAVPGCLGNLPALVGKAALDAAVGFELRGLAAGEA
jgi:hypothetical protein